jgi:hypothetical protein
VSYDFKNPYPGIGKITYPNSAIYVSDKAFTDKLMIIIEGSGWTSNLGLQNQDGWIQTHLGAQLFQCLDLRKQYIFLIPEKLKREPRYDYSGSMEDRANYTFKNLLDCYIDSINHFISDYPSSLIVLIGVSEGACLLPFIYEGMISNGKVRAMVAMAFGGLSLYESYGLLNTASFPPPEWKDMYIDFIDQYNPKNDKFIDSFEEDYYGLTHRWYNSFINIRPFDLYKDINIPVLFIHGKEDLIVSVESTRYIQENLPGKPFEYRYYNWGHQPVNYSDFVKLRNDIAQWVINIDQEGKL